MPLETRLLDFVRPARFWFEGARYRRTQNASRIQALRHSLLGQPLLIIGNGPSLNDTPLDDFLGVASIGMNKIDLLFDRVAWRPSLILCSNSLVMRQNQDFFRETDIPVFMNWKSRWFLRRSSRKEARYFYVNASPDFSTDVSAGVGMGATVTYVALQFAYYMGADPVVIFGVDHSFADKGPAHKVVKSSSDDVNHFDPNYFGQGVHWQLPDLEASEQAYERARVAFERDGRKVFDATIGGKLRIFPRISVHEARTLCGSGGNRVADVRTTAA